MHFENLNRLRADCSVVRNLTTFMRGVKEGYLETAKPRSKGHHPLLKCMVLRAIISSTSKRKHSTDFSGGQSPGSRPYRYCFSVLQYITLVPVHYEYNSERKPETTRFLSAHVRPKLVNYHSYIIEERELG